MNKHKWLTGGIPLVYLLLMVAIPALITLTASFRYPGEFGGLAPLNELTVETYQFFFSDLIYSEIFLKSVLMAAATTLICLISAYPLSLLIARSNQYNILIILLILPFSSNFLIRIYAWMILLGPQAALSRWVNAILDLLGAAPVQLLFSPFAVLIALVYVHLPFMVLPLYANLQKHDPALLIAAQDLGAGAWQRFWRITFPLSMPGIVAGSVLVFIPVLGMFAIPEILGGTGDMLIGNLIKEQFIGTRDWPFGATLSVMLTLTVLAVSQLAARCARPGGHYA
ncbi:MAG: ABC transporter permease [Gallionella sp.]|jgi:spermidine/putrescine transport system permease protein